MTSEADTSANGAPGLSLGRLRDIVVVLFLVVTGLVFGAGVLVPLTIALLLFVLLTAVIDRLSALKIAGRPMPGWLAHVLGLLTVIMPGLGMLSILSNQAAAVAEAIPRYEARFAGILSQIVALVGDDNYAAAKEAIYDMDLAAFASDALTSAGGFLSGLFLVLLYIPFMLAERGPMREKFMLAIPDPVAAAELTQVMQSISRGLQSYVGIKTLVSLITGLLSYAIMRPVGLDFAETWAVLAFALNFIPTIGSILGVILPSIVALVQFDTLTPFLIVALGCGAVQFTIGNILEPSLTGRTLNLSPLMVILALTFWSAIWGIAGAFLSVPITVCMLIIFSHIPGTRSLAILMSGDGQLMTNENEAPKGDAALPEAPLAPGKPQGGRLPAGAEEGSD